MILKKLSLPDSQKKLQFDSEQRRNPVFCDDRLLFYYGSALWRAFGIHVNAARFAGAVIATPTSSDVAVGAFPKSTSKSSCGKRECAYFRIGKNGKSVRQMQSKLAKPAESVPKLGVLKRQSKF